MILEMMMVMAMLTARTMVMMMAMSGATVMTETGRVCTAPDSFSDLLRKNI